MGSNDYISEFYPWTADQSSSGVWTQYVIPAVLLSTEYKDGLGLGTHSGIDNMGKISEDGKTIWWCAMSGNVAPSRASQQLNESNCTYQYIVFG